ncbi:phage tail protein [Fusobacterium varium]|uniref:phage tail-collar fiber domain-containing protein n=1 Tax=Fusobacterium varium TaxID=856 RepID=UPI0035699FB1
MGYNGLTNFGIEYQARMTAENKPVTLTKVRVGNGSIPASQTGATTTNLYSYKKEVEILAKEQVENAVKLQILLNNLDQEIGFYVKELGVYVQDGAEEKLYWYINKDNPSYLDDKNVPSKHRYNLFLEVTNVETIIINFTGQGLLADKKYVDDSIADFESGYNATINELRTSINSNLASGTLPTSLNSGEKIYKALQGNGGLKFDENLLYLNDSGVKKTGYYYLDRLTEGIFECIEQTETMVNNSSLFKNISNKANSDKLENLFKKAKKVIDITLECTTQNKYIDLELTDIRTVILQSERTSPIIITSDLFGKSISAASFFGGIEGPLGCYSFIMKIEDNKLYYYRSNYSIGATSPSSIAYVHNTRILIY